LSPVIGIDKANKTYFSIITVDAYLSEVRTRYPERLHARNVMCKLPAKFRRSPDGISSYILKCLLRDLCNRIYL